MIKGSARTVTLMFYGLGVLLAIFSIWALYITEIPQEQFAKDPRFQEEYMKYYEWLFIFGMMLIVGGGVIHALAIKSQSRVKE